MAIQLSYAVPGVDDTAAVGLLNYGASGGVSFTDAGDVYELLGRSSSMGVSGGDLGHLAIDLISFDEMGDMHSDINGFQIAYSGGPPSPLIDMHMIESNTKEFISFNVFERVGDALNFIFGRSEDIGCIN